MREEQKIFARRLIKAIKTRFTQRVFTRIYHKRKWSRGESVSGEGSTLTETAVIRGLLPQMLRELGARSILDAPCGDFHWMKEVDLDGIEYVGADIVAPLIARNREVHERPGRRFIMANVIKDRLPRADLVLCRDCLIHLSEDDALKAVRNLKRSGATYLLTTTYPERAENREIFTGDWRPVNLQLAPFAFPAPLQLINEQCRVDGGKWRDRSLGLWRFADIPC